jgi:rhodanese-related sulfurtransferase
MKMNTIDSLPSMRFYLRTALLLVVVLSIGAILTGCADAVAVDTQTATSQLISPVEYVTNFDDPASHLLIDVRTLEEFASGHIEGSVNIPVEEMPGRLDEIPGDAPVVVYCRSGNRSAAAARILTEAGYAPVYDLGGIQDWVAEGLPINN